MFWDGSRWVDESTQPPTAPTPSPRHRFQARARDWVATAAMGLALVGLVVPMVATSAATPPPARTLIANWSEDYETTTFQENNGRLEYGGRWTRADHPSYLGDHARFADGAGSFVKLTFTGTGISWVGPIGPTRGKATVYIDGKKVRTVDTHAGRFQPTRDLFEMTFDKLGKHRIAIRVAGTSGHPTVALDALVVRGKATHARFEPTPGTSGGPAATPGSTSTPAPGASATPAPSRTPSPTRAPDSTWAYASLQAGIDATASGGTLVVAAGTYREAITIRKPITLVATGVVIDGQHARATGIRISASDVTIKGIEVKNHTTANQHGAIEASGVDRVTLTDVRSHDNGGSGFSISGGRDHLILRGEYDHNTQQGYHAGGTTNLVMRGVSVHHNNVAWTVDPFWEAGAGKIVKATGTVIEDSSIYSNGGPGIWFDIDGNDSTIRRNKIWDNDLSGIFFEISSGASITDNLVWNNGRKDDRGWAWPANILISSSRDVDVSRNIVDDGLVGISALSQNRADGASSASGGAGYNEMSNIYIHDNDVLTHSGKLLGWYDPDGGSSFNDTSNRGSSNRYAAPDGQKFEWSGSTTNLAGFNATRGEAGGRFLTSAEVASLRAQLTPAP